MTLITDGGSTKCDWVLLDNSGELVFKTATLGLNPTVVAKEELLFRITSNETLKNVFSNVGALDFYGAGCGTATPRSILKEVLETLLLFHLTLYKQLKHKQNNQGTPMAWFLH